VARRGVDFFVIEPPGRIRPSAACFKFKFHPVCSLSEARTPLSFRWEFLWRLPAGAGHGVAPIGGGSLARAVPQSESATGSHCGSGGTGSASLVPLAVHVHGPDVPPTGTGPFDCARAPRGALTAAVAAGSNLMSSATGSYQQPPWNHGMDLAATGGQVPLSGLLLLVAARSGPVVVSLRLSRYVQYRDCNCPCWPP
jgi:hypothetical protein